MFYLELPLNRASAAGLRRQKHFARPTDAPAPHIAPHA
jgi:hypothetical protein